MTVLGFGPFEFDTSSGELRRGGVRIRLRPQPASVLAYLAGRAGELVTRAELHHELWRGEVHVNYDQGLNSCVKQIRRALRDGRSRSLIETLPRRGYRLAAAVKVIDAAPDDRLSDRIVHFFVEDVMASLEGRDLRRAPGDRGTMRRIEAAARYAVAAALADPDEPRANDPLRRPFIVRGARELRVASR
jgi:DNA-binding winged helix-turn-helix (wHTH) protein